MAKLSTYATDSAEAAQIQRLVGIQTLVTDITSDELLNMSSAPITVVPAPGAGKAIIPHSFAYRAKFGTVQYSSGEEEATIRYTNGSGPNLSGSTAKPNVEAREDLVSTGVFAPGLFPYPAIENKPIVMACGSDIGTLGVITAAVVGAGGSGYAVGDSGVVDFGDGNAQYHVDSVSGGAVTAFHFEQFDFDSEAPIGGSSYEVANGVPTYTNNGSGNGAFTVNVTAIAVGDGTARMIFKYEVIDLL